MRTLNRLSMRLLGNRSYFCVESKVSSGSGLGDFLILGLCLMYHQGGLLRNNEPASRKEVAKLMEAYAEFERGQLRQRAVACLFTGIGDLLKK